MTDAGEDDLSVHIETANELRAKALRARRHAEWLADDIAVQMLRSYADELEAQAAAIEGASEGSMT